MSRLFIFLSVLAVIFSNLSFAQEYEESGFRVGTGAPRVGIFKVLDTKSKLFDFRQKPLYNPLLAMAPEINTQMRKGIAEFKLPKAGVIYACALDNKLAGVFSIGYVAGKPALFNLADGDAAKGTTPYFLLQKTASGWLAMNDQGHDFDNKGDLDAVLLRQGLDGYIYFGTMSLTKNKYSKLPALLQKPEALIDPSENLLSGDVMVCVSQIKKD